MMAAAGLALSGAIGLAPGEARALTEDEARTLVQAASEEVLTLVRAPGGDAAKASGLKAIMERRAAFDRVAQFSAGRIWREMSEAQQAAYVDAFKDYVSRIYARRFAEYTGETVSIVRTVDAGKKGVVVKSEVEAANGGQAIPVDWLVSDRGGSGARIADIVIEGISMATTQREEIGALYEQKGGKIDALIEALRTL